MRCVVRPLSFVSAMAVAVFLAPGAPAANAEGALLTGLPLMTDLAGDPGRGPNEPSVAINAAGQAVLAWAGSPADAAMVSFRSASGAWTPPERLSPEGHVGEQVHVAIDAAGEATLAWAEGIGYYQRDVHVVRHTPAGFSKAQTFTETGGLVEGFGYDVPSATDIGLATNSAGEQLLTWTAYQRNQSGGPKFSVGVIFAAKSSGGGLFGTPQVLSDPVKTHREAPAGSINARGDIAVAWAEGDNPITRIRLRQQPAGGDFAPGQYLSTDTDGSVEPAVALAPDGSVMTTWWQKKAMLAMRVAPSGAVGAVQTLPGAYGGGFPFGPVSLASDAAGRLTAAWLTNDGLWTATAEPGADLGAASVIDRYANKEPSVAVEPGGGALLAWAEPKAFHGAWRPAGAAGFQTPATFPGLEMSGPRAALAGGNALLSTVIGEKNFARIGVTVGDPAKVAPPTPTPAPARDSTKPKLRIGAVKLLKRKTQQFPAGALTFAVGATEPTNVVATIVRRAAGVKRGGTCVARPAGKPKRKAKRCTVPVTVGAPLRVSVPTGTTTLGFTKAPKPGTYEIVLAGSDAAGNAAAAVSKRIVVR